MFDEAVPLLMANPIAIEPFPESWLPAGGAGSEWLTGSIAGPIAAAPDLLQFRLMTEAPSGLPDFAATAYAPPSFADSGSGFFIAADPGFGGNYYSSQSGDPPPEEGDEIVVIGKRPKNIVDDDDPYDPGTGGDPGTPGSGGNDTGGGGGTPPMTPAQQDCAKDTKADAIRDDINDDPQDGNERGAIIYKDSNGNVVSSPLSIGTPGSVTVPLPPGVSANQVIGYVHSHPLAPRTNNPASDALYDAADVYPSPSDWDQMDALVAAGANPATLSFYVVDMAGNVREYNYSDKAIYDVSEEQLLGINGLTAPPVPAPVPQTGGQCNS